MENVGFVGLHSSVRFECYTCRLEVHESVSLIRQIGDRLPAGARAEHCARDQWLHEISRLGPVSSLPKGGQSSDGQPAHGQDNAVLRYRPVSTSFSTISSH